MKTRERAVFLYGTLIFAVLLCAFVPQIPHAQESLSMTVTPPLFQLTIGPGESWSSALKIVNANDRDVEYYATPVDFEAQGEKGQGKFIPLVNNENSGRSLASWIEISREPVTVRRGTSAQIPFSVHIPENAEPGGHYAAILVGTNAPEDDSAGPGMKISSFVTSLLFVRIRGEAQESARIREFTASKSFYKNARADFSLRFENTGNTHLKPKGDITLYNMWGRERGKVDINQSGNFGNVLPQSIRKFTFLWQGEDSVLDIGRYSAVVTLSFGEEDKRSLVATTYFWVIPIVPVSITLSSILAFVILVTWLIRRYIRRALLLEKQRYGIPDDIAYPGYSGPIMTLMQPIREGAIDLRNIGGKRASTVTQSDVREAQIAHSLSFFSFLQKYSLFFFFIAVVTAAGFGVWMYLENVLLPERSYEITDVKSAEEAPENSVE